MIRTALRQPINNIVSGSRGLASSSQFRKVWEKETVNSLKQELGLRGLSRSGSKSALIQRIQAHEAAASSSSLPSTRSASSSPSPPTQEEKNIDLEAKPDTDTATLTAPGGVEVNSPALEQFEPKEVGQGTSTEAPGLPENPFDGGATTFDYKLPAREEEHEAPTPIPTIMAFQSSKYPPSSSKNHEEAGFIPQLVTAASQATHAINSPSISGADIQDAHTLELEQSDAEQAEAQEFKYQARPLTDEERSGLYQMLAVVGGLFGIGYYMKPEVKEEVHVNSGIPQADRAVKEGGKAADNANVGDALEKGAKKVKETGKEVKKDVKKTDAKGKAEGVKDDVKEKVGKGVDAVKDMAK